MRAEVKIGIVVGLVVIAGAVIFFVNQGRKTGSREAEVLPMDAPAGRVTAPAGKSDKPGDARQTPAPRASATDRTPSGGKATPAGTPADRTTGTFGRPPSGTPNAPAPAAGRPPTGTPPPLATPRPSPTAPPPERPPATQPREAPVVPPLVTPVEPPPSEGGAGPTTRPVAPPAEPAAGRPPGVSPPPRKETDTPAATPLPAAPRGEVSARKKRAIVEGDKLWSIAEEEYGDGNLWPKIKAANPGLDENRLLVGQVIIIPPKEERSPPAEAAKPAGKEAPGKETPATKKTEGEARPRTHMVAKGDTLRSIARNILHDESLWRQIYELNKSKIANPDILPVGIELRLPEKANKSNNRGG